MCGIAGFVNFSGHNKDEARALIRQMTDTMIHRGPDDDGFFVDDHVALGHRRLSIIDRSGGRQPMGTSDGMVHIVFNGEIYNFLQIRAELEILGHRFYSNSDTETILLSYLAWGDHCVEKLNGMFAFAIWDRRKRNLFLGRDRVGKKPLYYHNDGQIFSFASELKALRAGGLCSSEIDPEALDCYFTLGYIPAPRVVFKRVKKLRPAHTLSVSRNGLRERRYWALSFHHQTHYSLDQAGERLDDLLNQAVSCRLMSEVPLGAFLSGGLDSTLVVSSMSRNMARPVLTNSIGFGNKEYNELPIARSVAEYLGTDHHEFVVEPEAVEVIEKIAWYFDEPFADSSAIPTWYVCKIAKGNVTVVLSGDGGDEGFGGYTFRYIPHLCESKFRQSLPSLFRGPLFGLLGAIYPGSARLPKPLRLKTIFENLAVSDVEAFYRDLAWLRTDVRARLYAEDFLDSLRGFSPFEVVGPYYAKSDAADPLGRSQAADINVYMTDDVLVKVDRMSMAHSLEVRSPLLDHRILEFAAGLPTKLKIARRQGKIALRKLAADRLPAQVLAQPKRGFSIPAANWLKQELKPMAEQAIFGNNSLITDLLKRDELRKIWLEHQLGIRDHHVFLWGLMMLGLWEKNYL